MLPNICWSREMAKVFAILSPVHDCYFLCTYIILQSEAFNIGASRKTQFEWEGDSFWECGNITKRRSSQMIRQVNILQSWQTHIQLQLYSTVLLLKNINQEHDLSKHRDRRDVKRERGEARREAGQAGFTVGSGAEPGKKTTLFRQLTTQLLLVWFVSIHGPLWCKAWK